MTSHLLQCPSCKSYTLSASCRSCKQPTQRPIPPKFSLVDKYGSYRREIKKEELKGKGLY